MAGRILIHTLCLRYITIIQRKEKVMRRVKALDLISFNTQRLMILIKILLSLGLVAKEKFFVLRDSNFISYNQSHLFHLVFEYESRKASIDTI